MNAIAWRQLLAEGLIGLAVCLGGYLVVVEPSERRAAQVQAQADDLKRRHATLAASMPVDKARDVLRQVELVRRAVIDRERIVQDESSMFASVMDLAERHNVRVDQLLPTPSRQIKSAETEGATTEVRRGYAIVASAEYQNLVQFLDALQHRVGFTKVRSVKLNPESKPGSSDIIASIETEHIAFGHANATGTQSASAETNR